MKVTANEDTSYMLELSGEEREKLNTLDAKYLDRLAYRLDADSGWKKYTFWFYGGESLRLALEMLRFRGIH